MRGSTRWFSTFAKEKSSPQTGTDWSAPQASATRTRNAGSWATRGCDGRIQKMQIALNACAALLLAAATQISGKLDLAAPAAQGTLRNDDRGARLAAQLLQLAHGAIDRILGKRPEFLGSLAKGVRADLERYGNRAGGGHDLGLPDVEDRPRCVRFSVFRDGGQATDRPDAPVRENFLEIELVRLEIQLRGLEFGRGHCLSLRKPKVCELGPHVLRRQEAGSIVFLPELRAGQFLPVSHHG